MRPPVLRIHLVEIAEGQLLVSQNLHDQFRELLQCARSKGGELTWGDCAEMVKRFKLGVLIVGAWDVPTGNLRYVHASKMSNTIWVSIRREERRGMSSRG